MIRSRRSRPHVRRLLAIGLIAAAVFASGCVYLRLLELKRQFAQFDTYFSADTREGVDIICREPLLTPGDLRWLGIFPETLTTQQKEERWRVRWVKDAPPGEPETAVYDVELAARFENGRLAHVTIPERYFQYFPKELFVSLLRSAGGARIDRGSRSAEVENTPMPEKPSVAPPTLEAILGLLGRPAERSQQNGLEHFHYRYHAITSETKAKPIAVTFIFEPDTGRLHTLTAVLPRGTLHFKMSPAK
jgi:hypothetical protein